VLLSCENHSFIKERNKSLQDSISLFIEKANNYEIPKSKALEHLVKAESLVNALPKDSMYFKKKVYVGFIYYNLGNKEKYKTLSFELINDAIEAKDSFYLARAYSYIGDYYTDKVVLDSAVIYYQNAEKVYFGIKDNIGIGRMHVKMAIAKFRARDYLGSEKSAVMAFTYIRLANNKLLEYEANSTLGLACVETKDYEKAEEYFQKAYKIAREENLENLGQYQSKAISLNNLGFLYLKSGKYKEALNYFNQANQDSNLNIEFPELYATILDNKAKAKLAYHQAKGSVNLVADEDSATGSKNFDGWGYGFGIKTFLNNNVFVKAEASLVEYDKETYGTGDESVSFKPETVSGLISIGYKF
jgi:tetratricopeptide (TPR) repeat protein